MRDVAVAAILLLALGACGGGGSGQPTAPAAPPATPLPGPTAEPPVSASCVRLPLGSPTYTCRDEGAEFLGDVTDAIDTLKSERPEFFRDGSSVTNLGGHYVGLIRIHDRKGLCAAYDGEEIQVKRSNEWSEHYDVNLSDKYVCRGTGSFRGSCYPAAF